MFVPSVVALRIPTSHHQKMSRRAVVGTLCFGSIAQTVSPTKAEADEEVCARTSVDTTTAQLASGISGGSSIGSTISTIAAALATNKQMAFATASLLGLSAIPINEVDARMPEQSSDARVPEQHCDDGNIEVP